MQLVGMAECKVVATLLQKKHRDISWSFDSMEEAASEFVELFGKEVGKTLACSFAATPKKEAAASSCAPTSSSGVGTKFVPEPFHVASCTDLDHAVYLVHQ